ncbi:hypothetical protein [Arthrobacter agilis]|uniref:hypothetical protein n=1 Tax=Arthrobacter agilis TaxID=37921 RepID=UPI002782DF9D|nr:hypothetical protein [Arthrobacter agilis]MDQ0734482.1 DNA repair ATPase RecN [Arthrobacter agilis]
MSTSHRILAGPVAMGVMIVVLAGCGSSGTTEASTSTSSPSSSSSPSSTPEEAGAARLCEAATAFSGAVTGFRDTVTPEATIEELRSARDEVVKTYREMDRAAMDVAEERMTAVAAAERKLEKAVDDVREQATVPEAVESLRNEASDLQTAVTDLAKEVEC